MKYELQITTTARRQLKKLEDKTQKAIRKKLDELCDDQPTSSLDIKKLKGREGYRLRVGDYRVIYRLHNDKLIVEVMEVGHRREIY